MRSLAIVSFGASVLAGSVLHFDDAASTMRVRSPSSVQANEAEESKIGYQIQRTQLPVQASQGLKIQSSSPIQAHQAAVLAANNAPQARLTRRMISRQPSGSKPHKFHHSYSESSMAQTYSSQDKPLSTKSKSQGHLLMPTIPSRESSPWRYGSSPSSPYGHRNSLDRSPSPRRTNSVGSFRDDSPWRHGGGAVHESAPIRHGILGFDPADPYPPPPRTMSQESMFKQGSLKRGALSRASSLLRTGSPPKTGGLTRGGSFARQGSLGKEGKLSRTVSFAQDIVTPFSESPSGSSRGLSRTSSLSKSDVPSEPTTPVARPRPEFKGPQTPTTPVTPLTPGSATSWKSGS